MTVEAITYISDLVITNPLAADFINEGDDHIKGIKSALKSTFPSVTGAVTSSHTELNMLDGLTGTILTSTSAAAAGNLVQLSDTAVTAVSAIDFVNGSGGVVIDGTYEEYLLHFTELARNTAGGILRLQLATDGVTFPSSAAGSDAQSHVIASGVATVTNHGALAYFPVLGSQTSTAPTSTSGAGGQVLLTRRAPPLQADILSRFQHGDGNRGGWCHGRQKTVTSAFNAIRLSWDSGTFVAQGRIRLYGRKA